MSLLYRISFSLVLVSALSACRQAAIQEVRKFSADYEAHLTSSPARINDPQVDQYLRSVADEIRNSAAELHARQQEELTSAGKKLKPEELEFYDAFHVYLVS